MSDPAVTVVIPVYNGTNYLREAIASVEAQTFRDFEIVVVDDGSTDGTWELIRSYGDRVRGFRKPNGGVASALNLGIANSRGQYVAWLSHDDLFTPVKLERQVRFLSSGAWGACYTDYQVCDPQGRIVREVETPWYPRHQALRALFGRAYIGGSTTLVKRSVFEAAGPFSERLRYTQDTEMWFRLLRLTEIGRVPEKLAVEWWHPGQGSQSVDVMRAEAQAMYTGMFEQLGVAALFPEETSPASPRAQARARTWLGDTMLANRRWYDYAEAQYRTSVSLWPSLGNPARWRLLVGAKRLYLPLRALVRLGRAP